MLFIAIVFALQQINGATIERNPLHPGRYYCGRQKFEVVNASIFSEPKKVIKLSLIGCGIKRIEPFAFSELTNCDEISLTANELKEIRKNDFTGLNKLKKLYIIENKIKTMDYEAFKLPTMEDLSLSRNPLEKIDLGFFVQPSSLENLFFQNTTANIVYPKGLNQTSNLHHLALNDPQPDGNVVLRSLHNFRNLTSLHVAINAFVGGVKINSVLEIFPKIKFLGVNNCRVMKLDENFKNDKCLQKLIK